MPATPSESSSDRDALAVTGSPRSNPLFGALGLFALVFLVYWPAIRGQFVWDDLLIVQKNPLVTGEFRFHSIWFQTDFPLTTVAFWLEWLAWGKNPVGYHLINNIAIAGNQLSSCSFNSVAAWQA